MSGFFLELLQSVNAFVKQLIQSLALVLILSAFLFELLETDRQVTILLLLKLVGLLNLAVCRHKRVDFLLFVVT